MKKILKTRRKACFQYLFLQRKESGLPEPRFKEFDNMFWGELLREDSAIIQVRLRWYKV